MSRENKDSAFENFMKEAFGSDVENESQLKPGAPVFANREVPADILQAAQQAMKEQTGLQNSQTSEKAPKDKPVAPKADQNSTANNSNSLKISRVRFIDNLPKKKAPSSSDKVLVKPQNAVPGKVSQPSQAMQQPLEPPESLTSTIRTAQPISNVVDQTLKRRPEPGASPAASSDKNTQTESHSFREEIMARLRAEAESYDLSSGTASNDSSHQNSPASNQNIPPAPSTTVAQPNVPNQDSSTVSKVPTKEDFLMAAGARPKKLPQIVDSSAKTSASSNNRVYIPEGSEKLSPAIESRSRRSQELTKEERKDQKKKRKQKSNIHLGRSIAIILVLAFLAVGGFGYFYLQSNLKAVDPKNKTALVIDIPESTSSRGVAQILEKNGLIKNATVFSLYMKAKGLSNFKSGYYSLNKAMTPTQIAEELEKGGSATSPAEGKITIPEGYTVDQMAAAMTVNADSKTSASTPFTQDEFLKVVKDPSFISQMAAKYPQLFANLPAANSGVKYQLEGYLFPATYSYNAKTTVKDIVEQMIAAMDKTLKPYYAQLSDLNLNVNDLLSLAALVEKEASTADDRKNVADVFLKRLNESMTLDSNVALLYAEGKLGSNVSAADDANVDTSMNSPFNLYQNQGTGPGPIDSPSAMSLDAVINHTKNSYYYFYADLTTGKVYFSETLEEQQAVINEYAPQTSSSQ